MVLYNAVSTPIAVGVLNWVFGPLQGRIGAAAAMSLSSASVAGHGLQGFVMYPQVRPDGRPIRSFEVRWHRVI